MWSRTYKTVDGAKNPFPSEIGFYEIPSGTYCKDIFDAERNLHAIALDVDGMIDYGLDYAFEFLIFNPIIPNEPRLEDNFWHFETRRDGVILHIQENVTGFRLEQIKEVVVTPQDTTTLLSNNVITFYIMSDKFISGGSKITITAPAGFVFLCARFRTSGGLSNSTTCFVPPTRQNIGEFQIDSQDSQQPNSPSSLFVTTANPQFTPQYNWFSVEISYLGKAEDIRDKIPSFDITGRVLVDVQATFPYVGNANILKIIFTQSTILNQADDGNEIVVTAPEGYTFPRNCTDFLFQLSNAPAPAAIQSSAGYQNEFVYPPPGTTCNGFNNRSLVVTLPDGAGLLRNNYTLEISVMNPAYIPTTPNIWEFITRVRNSEVSKIVDANRTLQGFKLQQLLALTKTEGAANGRFSLATRLLSIVVVVSSTIAAAKATG
jgi:hypothetical protein